MKGYFLDSGSFRTTDRKRLYVVRAPPLYVEIQKYLENQEKIKMKSKPKYLFCAGEALAILAKEGEGGVRFGKILEEIAGGMCRVFTNEHDR